MILVDISTIDPTLVSYKGTYLSNTFSACSGLCRFMHMVFWFSNWNVGWGLLRSGSCKDFVLLLASYVASVLGMLSLLPFLVVAWYLIGGWRDLVMAVVIVVPTSWPWVCFRYQMGDFLHIFWDPSEATGWNNFYGFRACRNERGPIFGSLLL
jgi:hypothetical protein